MFSICSRAAIMAAAAVSSAFPLRKLRACAFGVAIGLLGAVGVSQPSMATILTIDGSGAPYVESGFTIDPIRIVSGNCDGVSGKPCMALNTNETSTLSKVGGGSFTLDSFGFEFQGQPSVLTLTEFSGASLVATLVYDQTQYDKNIWYPITLNLPPTITSAVFDDTGTGNIRIDDIGVTAGPTPPCTGNGCPIAVPEPGSLALLGGGLIGLGLVVLLRRRREDECCTSI